MGIQGSSKRAFDNGDYYAYWTRSPYATASTNITSSYSNYIWRMPEDGVINYSAGITNATTPLGVLIEISF